MAVDILVDAQASLCKVCQFKHKPNQKLRLYRTLIRQAHAAHSKSLKFHPEPTERLSNYRVGNAERGPATRARFIRLDTSPGLATE